MTEDIYWKIDGGGFCLLGSPEDGYLHIGKEEHERIMLALSGGARLIEYDHETNSLIIVEKKFLDRDSVDAERDRRINGGFTFDGRNYDSDGDSRQSIAENGNLAGMAIINKVAHGTLDWLIDGEDFGWIDHDNNFVPMDAFTMVDLARAAAAHKSALVMAARRLKDLEEIPADYADDKHWS